MIEVLAADRAGSPEAVRAFQEAAQRAVIRRHPNVNLTLDFGEARGRHYLVRELEEGHTLADMLGSAAGCSRSPPHACLPWPFWDCKRCTKKGCRPVRWGRKACCVSACGSTGGKAPPSRS